MNKTAKIAELQAAINRIENKGVDTTTGEITEERRAYTDGYDMDRGEQPPIIGTLQEWVKLYGKQKANQMWRTAKPVKP